MNRRKFVKSAAIGSLYPWLYLPQTDSFESEFRVAVIGHTGRGNFGHGMDTLWLRYPGCRLVAVSDPVPEGLEKAKSRLGGIKGYRDFNEMLRIERPDIVSVAARHIDQHRDMIVAAANAGARGIYVEKPFCRNLKEADEIIAACQQNNTKLALAHRNRYHPALQEAQKMIAQGGIGKITEIRGRGKEDHRGGVLDLWVLGSHVLNLIPLFSGAFISCCAELLNGNVLVARGDLVKGDEGVGAVGGDRLHARFQTASGIPVYFDSIRGAGVREGNFGFQILGNKGVLDIRIDSEPLVSYFPASQFFPVSDRPEWVPVTSGGAGVPEPIAAIKTDIGGHHAAVRDLLTAVTTETSPLCNAKEGRSTIEAIMAVFESHRLGGRRVEFPVSVLENPLKNLA